MKYELEVDDLGVFGDFKSKNEAVTAFRRHVAANKSAGPCQFPSSITLKENGRAIRRFVGAHEVGAYRESAQYKAQEKLIHKHALDAGLLASNYIEAIIECLASVMHICDDRDVDFTGAVELAATRYREEIGE